MKNGTQKTLGTLTLRRTGTFKVTTAGDSHCGTVKDLTVTYRVAVVCGADLDARGFLFDQINVDNFFQTIKQTRLSCEQLCIDCARKLWRRILDENPGCDIKTMELELSPAPNLASMTFNYDAARDGKKQRRPR